MAAQLLWQSPNQCQYFLFEQARHQPFQTCVGQLTEPFDRHGHGDTVGNATRIKLIRQRQMHSSELRGFGKQNGLFKSMGFIGELIDVELQQSGVARHGSLKPASQAITVAAFFGNLRRVEFKECFVAWDQMVRACSRLQVLELLQHIVIVFEKRKLMSPAFPLRRRVRRRAATGTDFCGTAQQ